MAGINYLVCYLLLLIYFGIHIWKKWDFSKNILPYSKNRNRLVSHKIQSKMCLRCRHYRHQSSLMIVTVSWNTQDLAQVPVSGLKCDFSKSHIHAFCGLLNKEKVVNGKFFTEKFLPLITEDSFPDYSQVNRVYMCLAWKIKNVLLIFWIGTPNKWIHFSVALWSFCCNNCWRILITGVWGFQMSVHMLFMFSHQLKISSFQLHNWEILIMILTEILIHGLLIGLLNTMDS